MTLRNNPSSRFFTDVCEVVKLIPVGRVTSYGAIACYIGATKSARVVGWALHQAALAPDVPAHRVVNRNGCLTGKHHFGNENQMQQRLEAEGIKVKNDQVVDFESIFWDPGQALL